MNYTYDLLSVNNLRQPDARVENGRFFPEGAAYRALGWIIKSYLQCRLWNGYWLWPRKGCQSFWWARFQRQAPFTGRIGRDRTKRL